MIRYIREGGDVVMNKMAVDNGILSGCKSFLSMISVVEPDSESVNFISEWLSVFLGDVSVLGIL